MSEQGQERPRDFHTLLSVSDAYAGGPPGAKRES